MSVPLLKTKFHIPSIRPELVSRPRLVEQLNAGLYRKLALISAPAGFGKTTLLSEWIAGGEWLEPKVRFAWLSLDEGDNDLARFLTYFIAALQTLALSADGTSGIEGTEANIGQGALSTLQSPQPLPTESVLTALINEIAAIPDRVVLILDDYHLIEAQPIHDALTFLARHLPPQMHLVIATREDPPLPLARLRAQDQLTELRGTDLRFTSAEATEFFNHLMGLDLSTEDIAALEARTEGWIAGLQLAAISMQGREDTASLIKSFTGSHHYVLDYLIEEVLDQQSESIQTFLLQTAVLDRLSGPLCDAVRFGTAETQDRFKGTALADQDDGQTILEKLLHSNLFIVPLDEELRWYRYHHLFADLLHQRLRQSQPEQVPILHRRASEWYEENGFINEAIEHSLRGEDCERAAHLIEEQADALWLRGEHGKLRRWLGRIPDEMVLSMPQLCLYHGYYLLSAGQQEAGERFLQVTEKALESRTSSSAQDPPSAYSQLSGSARAKLEGRVATVRALIGSYSGDVPGMINHATKALEYLPEQDSTWRSLAALSLGDAYSYLGDMAASYQARSEAVRACQAAGDVYYTIVASLKLASTLNAQGELQRTAEICRQQVQLATEYGLTQSGSVGCLMAMWGEVLAEMNDLDGAILQAKKGAELAERGRNLALLGYGYLYLMRVLFSREDLAGAEEIIQKVADIDRESDAPPWLTNQMMNWQTRIWLTQDELGAASQWMEERGLDPGGEREPLPEMSFSLLFDYIMLARVQIARGLFDEAIGLLQDLAGPAKEKGRITRVIEILMLQALALQAQENTDQACATLGRALTLAEPRGFIRIFVDEGPPMARLLYKALDREIEPDYVRRLLAAFPVDESVQAGPTKPQPDQSELVEALSERELEVLQLVAEGLTNSEIASRLYLSLNTVKVHTRNIYGKLSVHSRTQAIARSQELGLLPRR